MNPKIILFTLVSICVLVAGSILHQIFPENSFVSDTRTESDAISGGVRVARVVDGDTIELENGDKIRYIGIDTPESVDPRKPVECFGKEATEKNRELVERKVVHLEKDISEKDHFGRLLRYVWVELPGGPTSTFVNRELVRQGYAFVATFPPDIKYEEDLRQAEREARETARGLWSGCPVGGKK